VDDRERIVLTNAPVGGWRPAEQPFMTAVITLRDHPDGWGTVAGQLAALVEQRV
jgi:hypothetical protein